LVNARGIHIPGLDGLRAVAVLAVVASHSWPQMLIGGWAGVDIFFVLSGFLITSILLAEHERTGRISFQRFYMRRALRLLPALAVTLLLGVLIAQLIYPKSAGDTVHEAFAAALYVANWVVAFGQVHSGLLIHTWTLSIEEQFYWTWPLALAVLLRIGGRRLALRVTIAVIAVVVVHRLMGVQGAYFRTDTRADSLLIGCAVAIAASMGAFERLSRRAICIATLIGTLALGFVFAFAQQASPFMEGVGYTLVALASATVVIALAVRPLSPVTATLGWRPLTWIGQRSYGVYLYHPLCLAVVATRLGMVGPATLVTTTALSLAAAAVSYRYLETPFLRLKDRKEESTARPRAHSKVRPTQPSRL
jgi:peptidoglycan/LPS O-acetylase OafA/YrhL